MRRLWFSFVSGLRDTRRVAGRAALLAFQVGVMSVLVGLSSGMVAQSFQDIEATRALSGRHSVYFVLGDGRGSAEAPADELRQVVTGRLASGNAYSVRRSSGSGDNALVVYGAFPEVFGLGYSEQSRPYALAGERAGVSPGTMISVDGRSIPVVGVMGNASYLDLWMEYTPLDTTIVVVADTESELMRVSDEQVIDIASRMTLIDPSIQEIADYWASARKSVPIFPRWVAEKTQLDFLPELQGRAAFLGVFGAGLLTTLVGTFAGLNALIRSRSRDYAIHGVVGASFGATAVRLAAFVVSAWTIPSLVCGWAGLQGAANGRHVTVVLPILALVAVITSVLVTVIAARQLVRSDDLAQVRERVW